MKKITGNLKRCSAALALIAVSALSAHAQASGSADPFTVWDHADNPAAWGFFPDALAFGFGADAPVSELATYAGGAWPGSLRFVYGVPGLLYRYRSGGGTEAHELSTSAALGNYFSMGFRFRWDSAAAAYAPAYGLQDLGLIMRPVPYASLALSLEDVFDAAGDGFGGLGLGVSVRPLAFDPRLGPALSLSADFGYGSDGFSVRTTGARVALGSWLTAAGSYDWRTGAFGLGAAIALSGVETSAGTSFGAAGTQASASLNQAFRVGRGSPDAGRVLGGAILVIEDPGIYAPAPPLVEFDSGIEDLALWFGQAVAAIDKAAKDPTIKALAMIGPPRFESEGRAQEFSRALGRFKKAGKKIYVHAESMDRLQYVYAAALADYLSVDPNGMLPLLDVALFSPYFGGLLRRVGVDTYSLRSHPTKTANNVFTEDSMTEAERAMKERFVGGLAAQGYEALGAARGAKLPGGAKAAIAGGPYLDPRKAVEAGLVDALSYEEEFLAKLDGLAGKAARVTLERYAREPGRGWGAPIAKRVAIVHLVGSIIDDKGVAGASIGESAAELLAALREDPMTAGVILRVDSGGGSAKTSDHIAREVKKLREAGKPVVASMAGYAASGGYYVSVMADAIVAEAGTLTGSIGVTGMDLNFTRLLDELDIGAGLVAASDSGAFGNPYLPRRAEDGEKLKAYIGYIYDRFVDVVAEGRKMDKAKVDELGKGQIWLGSEALANGLVDRLGGLDDAKAAMEALLKGKANFVDYLPGEFNPDMLASLFGGALAGAFGLDTGSGKAVEAAVDALRLASELAAMGPGPLYLEPACFTGLR